jgi:hypothetical protein
LADWHHVHRHIVGGAFTVGEWRKTFQLSDLINGIDARQNSLLVIAPAF